MTGDHARYRLGLDVGTNSLGWAAIRLDGFGEPTNVLDAGVRILSPNEEAGRDPQRGTSKAVDRRAARSMRRNRDRRLRRKGDLMAALVRHGLMPEDPAARKALEDLDPYRLRAKGLDEALTPHELGRAIFHLAQRRGFKSNRKTEKPKEDDSGKIKSAISSLQAAMAESGARTVGEYLWRLHRKGRSVRARLEGQGAKATYNLYLARELIEAEFDALWTAQARFNPALSDAARDEIGGTAALRRQHPKDVIVFRQRPLRPVSPGKCSLIPEDERAPKALPIAQRFRILKELANLRVGTGRGHSRFLTVAERDRIYALLLRHKDRNFGHIRKALGLDGTARFNLEDDKRDKLQGDETAARLSAKKAFGKAWRAFDLARQSAIVERLLDEEDETVLLAWLAGDCGLNAAEAEDAARAALPQGHLRFGRKALAALVACMESESAIDKETGEVLDQPIGEFDALARLFPERPDQYQRARLPLLPYYGTVLSEHVMGDSGDPRDPKDAQFGRIANPTVHIGLNQIRLLVNALIRKYGPPEAIVIEFARSLKLSQSDKDKRRREQKANQDANDRRRAQLRALGQPVTADNLLRLRLWEELDPGDAGNRCCVFTGRPIAIHQLFSGEVEVEHLLPFSQSLDNSAANKTVCFREANRRKARRAPYEAFHNDADWPEIHARAQSLPPNKRWRFDAEAMERFETDERDFIDRQLTDTAYLARIARKYLGYICDPAHIWVTPGRLTALLRGKWGLNRLLEGDNVRALDFESLSDDEVQKIAKNRDDHRHHTIDAAVVAVTSRATLKRVSDAAKLIEASQLEEGLKGLTIEPPWDGFRDDLREALRGLVVSHRPDHGEAGKLHEETAYGLVVDPAAEENYNLVYRKPLAGLGANEIARIRDKTLRTQVQDYLARKAVEGIAHKEALAQYAAASGIRRVRLLKRQADVIGIADCGGTVYKAYIPGDNHRIEIFRRPGSDKWEGEAVTVFQANQKGYLPGWCRTYPDAEHVMTVHNGDLLKAEIDGAEVILRVVRLHAKGNRLYLVEAHAAGDFQKRHDAPDHLDPFRWKLYSYSRLQALKARPVRVDVLGRVWSR